MKIGFTGTRQGMTGMQLDFFLKLLPTHIDEFHHGLCEGSDTEAHYIVRGAFPSAKIIGHPSTDKTHEVDSHCDELLPPMGHLARNRVIADAVDYMYATPPSMEELPRGGTWYTIRYAIKKKVPCLIIYPDGCYELR